MKETICLDEEDINNSQEAHVLDTKNNTHHYQVRTSRWESRFDYTTYKLANKELKTLVQHRDIYHVQMHCKAHDHIQSGTMIDANRIFLSKSALKDELSMDTIKEIFKYHVLKSSMKLLVVVCKGDDYTRRPHVTTICKSLIFKIVKYYNIYTYS